MSYVAYVVGSFLILSGVFVISQASAIKRAKYISIEDGLIVCHFPVDGRLEVVGPNWKGVVKE